MCNCNGNIVQTIANGTVGLGKVLLRIDIADDTDIKARRDICRECEHATKNAARLDRPTKGLTVRSKCDLCKCYIQAKTQLKKESCPLEKWKAIG